MPKYSFSLAGKYQETRVVFPSILLGVVTQLQLVMLVDTTAAAPTVLWMLSVNSTIGSWVALTFLLIGWKLKEETTPWSFKMSHCLWNYLTVICWCSWESKVFSTSVSFELSVTQFDIFGEKFQPNFAFFFCKIIYIWNILILKEHQALVPLVCMFDCDVPKNSEARINITRPKILLKHDL